MSSVGVTGARASVSTRVETLLQDIKEVSWFRTFRLFHNGRFHAINYLGLLIKILIMINLVFRGYSHFQDCPYICNRNKFSTASNPLGVSSLHLWPFKHDGNNAFFREQDLELRFRSFNCSMQLQTNLGQRCIWKTQQWVSYWNF